MEPPGRRPGAALIERIRAEDRRFEFAQASILLQRLFAGSPDDRPVRYRGDASLAFPAAEAEVEEMPGSAPGETGRLRVSFVALAGMMGVLPAHYAELIEERRRAGDDGLREFLAIFEDRIVRLMLQAHRHNRFWLRFAWNAGIRADDSRVGATAFERMILSLVGTAGGNLRLRAGLPAAAQVHYGGLLAQHPLNADSLSSVVADFFGVECAIDQMQGNWVDIPPAALSRLGSSRGASLGVDLIAGDRYFDPALGIRMELGPMRLGRFQSLLPGTEGAGALEDFARVALGGSMQFDYSLVLVKEEVPDARLTHEEDAAQRLGWSFWLFAGDEPSDAECGPLHGRRIDQPTHSRT